MQRMLCVFVVVLGLAALSGCAMVGNYAFTDVNVQGSLSPQTVARYESEWKAVQASAGSDCCMAELELTNWWPLGLLLYWDRGSVMRSETANGPIYMVSKAWGLGPLCTVYVAEDMAVFDAKGQRLSGMNVWNMLLGMVGMVHNSDAILVNGQRQTMSSGHLAHHLIAYHAMDGHTQISMLTGPNPVGFDMHSGPAMQGGQVRPAGQVRQVGGVVPAPTVAPAPVAPTPALVPAAIAPGNEAIVYTCSMHPEVVQAAPGNCPKCGMRLVPRRITVPATEIKP